MNKLKLLTLTFIIFVFTACSTNDIQNIAKAVIYKDPSILAKAKTIEYASNPKKIVNDLKNVDKFFKEFVEAIVSIWGEKNAKVPEKKEYVKYMQNYKSRALIDFDKGIVRVETLDEKDYKSSLKNAIVTTLLLPDDPRAANLFDAKEVKFGETPYLYEEVLDDQQKAIRYEWRANRYADILIKEIRKSEISVNGQNKNLYYINIDMVKDHANIRVKKFKPFVEKYAKKFNISKNLIYAVIQTESNFNQFAVSSANAYGLMQVVPTSAGKDAYKYVKGKSWTPSKNYLFDANNNIELGSGYLALLENSYLKGIQNPISKEYCIISAYNTGSGNVLRTFNRNKTRAIEEINKKTPQEIYEILIKKLPYEETRKYLQKVIKHKKDFIAI